MASVGSLIFELAADISRLRTDLKRAQGEIKRSLDSIAQSSLVTATAMGANFAMKFATAFGNAISTGVEQVAAMGRLAERFGTTSEAISALDYVARRSNLSTDTLAGSMRNLSRTMIAAQSSSSTQAGALRAIGLSVDELRNKDPAQAMADIADAMSGFKDGADKVAVARAIFGKTGDELIPMLNKGGAAFRDLEDRAKALGLVVSNDAAQGAIEFSSKLTDLNAIVDGLKRQLAAELNPTISAFVDWAIEAAQEGGTLEIALHAIAAAANIAAQAFVGLTGLASAGAKAVAIWKGLREAPIGDLAAQKKAREQAMSGWEDIRRTMDQTADAQKKIQAQYEAGVKGLQQHSRTTSETAKKTLDFKGAMEKAGGAAKTAKAGVDEYAKMLESLQEELRRTEAAGDSMMLLITDPKFLAFTADQQANIVAYRMSIDDLARAQEQEKDAHEAWKKGFTEMGDLAKSNAASLDSWAQTQLDAIDPTREFHRELDLLNAALAEGSIVGEEYHAVLGNIIDRFDQSVQKLDPLKQQTDDLTRAIEQFGRNSADMFVDWISGADSTSKSFGEMTASILRDIAKMLLYKQVMQPLFDWFGNLGGGGSGGGLLGWFGGLLGRSAAAEPMHYAGARMAGGPVLPGRLYRVNESPFAREFFAPSVAGRVGSIRDDGGINVSITVNAQTGATDVQGTTADAIELGKRMAMVARQVIADEQRAGGLLA